MRLVDEMDGRHCHFGSGLYFGRPFRQPKSVLPSSSPLPSMVWKPLEVIEEPVAVNSPLKLKSSAGLLPGANIPSGPGFVDASNAANVAALAGIDR